jgi:integrating conjugative element relaxase (TIGR03760 family)
MSQLLPICTAEQLFAQCKLDPNLAELRTLAGLDAPVFDLLIKTPIYQFAELVQLAPASEAHHHAGPGGLLKHTLDVITLALKKRRGFQLPIAGSLSEISTQRHLWTYAIFVGCLLHDIGKLSANTRLILIAKDGSEKPWTPHSGTMTHLKNLKGYRIEFRKTPYHYHAHLALTHWDLIPKEARTWLIEASNIMAELTAWLWGDKFESGTIGDIVEAADRESTAKDLQLPNEPRFSNAIPVIERYLKIIRQWIQDGTIKINTNGGMGWVDEYGHLYLVCRSLAEKLIQECNSQGLKHLPQDPVRVYDILQEHGYALPTDDGKAIWPIRVKTSGYEHKFTCLKFEARKLTLPSRPLRALEGEISIVTTDIQETVTTLQGAESIETTAFELEPAKEDLNNTQREISNAAYAKESDEEMPSDEDILTAEISDYIPDAIQESAPIRDTVEDNSATAITSQDSEKSPLQETEAAVADQETGF